MNDRLFDLILALIPIICTILTVYIIPFIKAKIDNENLVKYEEWVNMAVRAAEILFIGSGKGSDKKAYVVKFLTDMFNQNKITITEEQMNILIESAVQQMNENKTE
jgi:LL-H family phage holin